MNFICMIVWKVVLEQQAFYYKGLDGASGAIATDMAHWHAGTSCRCRPPVSSTALLPSQDLFLKFLQVLAISGKWTYRGRAKSALVSSGGSMHESSWSWSKVKCRFQLVPGGFSSFLWDPLALSSAVLVCSHSVDSTAIFSSQLLSLMTYGNFNFTTRFKTIVTQRLLNQLYN